MRPPTFTEEEQALIDAAPGFFATDDGTATPWSQRGFEIGRGWHPIVREMAIAIAEVAPGARCTQVKEKFGALRVYTWADPLTTTEVRDAIRAAIDAAEARSLQTCERCGNLGQLIQNETWWRVRCPLHRDARARG